MASTKLSHSFTAKIGGDSYPIIIGKGVFSELGSLLKIYPEDSVFIICDSYFNNFKVDYKEELKLVCSYKHVFLEGGVESKLIFNYEIILKLLIDNKIKKDGVIVAIGGGVIGDISAFVASTYQRGIDLIHVPTTTTAMIDSSVGGKTGLNFSGQVNLIGTYYNPKAIFMELGFLITLNRRDYYSGICEAIKMSITSDLRMFNRLFSLSEKIKNKDINSLEELIYWSILTKLKHVGDDPKEKSTRLILNYGHTFGQSIETFYGLSQDNIRHGEAIALGIIVAARLSLLIKHNDQTFNLWKQTNKILEEYNLPNNFSKLNTKSFPSLDSLVDNLYNDKKCLSFGNRFILCEKIGEAGVKFINNQDLISQAFNILF